MNKERIAQCEDALRRSKEYIALDILEQLERENRIIEDILIGEQIETDRLKEENEQLKQQIEKMKCCGNCKHCDSDNPCRFHRENRQCDNYGFWELVE